MGSDPRLVVDELGLTLLALPELRDGVAMQYTDEHGVRVPLAHGAEHVTGLDDDVADAVAGLASVVRRRWRPRSAAAPPALALLWHGRWMRIALPRTAGSGALVVNQPSVGSRNDGSASLV